MGWIFSVPPCTRSFQKHCHREGSGVTEKLRLEIGKLCCLFQEPLHPVLHGCFLLGWGPSEQNRPWSWKAFLQSGQGNSKLTFVRLLQFIQYEFCKIVITIALDRPKKKESQGIFKNLPKVRSTIWWTQTRRPSCSSASPQDGHRGL